MILHFVVVAALLLLLLLVALPEGDALAVEPLP